MQDTEFDFSHVEPTAMFGGVVDFQFGGNAARLSRRERFIQRCEFVRVQIVHHQDDRVCLREMDIDQVAHAVGEIDIVSLAFPLSLCLLLWRVCHISLIR